MLPMLADAARYYTTVVDGAKLIVAIGTAAGVLWRAHVLLSRLVRQNEWQTEQLKKIAHEVFPNGGSSMRDSVVRTELMMKQVAAIQRNDLETREEIAVWTDARGEVIHVTAGYTDLTGLSTEEAKHEGWQIAIFDDDRAEVVRGWHEAVDRKTAYVAQIRFVNPRTGMMTLCKSVASPMPDNAGWAARIVPLADPVPTPREADEDVDPRPIAKELLASVVLARPTSPHAAERP